MECRFKHLLHLLSPIIAGFKPITEDDKYDVVLRVPWHHLQAIAPEWDNESLEWGH